MNEQLVNELIKALHKQALAQQEQTAAINRLAESNESLCAVIVESLAGEEFDDTATDTTYLSGKKRG